MKKLIVKKAAILMSGLCVLYTGITPVYATPTIVKTRMGAEYEMMEQGNWPKEVTFSDTAFTNEQFAVCVSKLGDKSTESSSAHSFTLKAGEKIDFELISPSYPALNYYESLISWKDANQTSVYGIGFDEEGVYGLVRNKESCHFQVTDFGFENDLSDLSAHVVMTLDLPAYRVMSSDEYLDYNPDNLYGAFKEAFDQQKSEKHDDIVHIRAEGDVTISPYYNYSAYNYLGGTGSAYDTPQETDSVGFGFIFESGTLFEVSLNDNPSRTVEAFPQYYDIWAEEPAEANWEVRKPLETLYYNTPSIVLVDSDLVERDINVSDAWEKEHAPKNQTEQEVKTEPEVKEETAVGEEPETGEPVAAESKSGMNPLVIVGIVAVILAAAAVYFAAKKKKE